MQDYCAKVNKFLGVDDGGNCLCGPYLPNGMVRLGPDTSYPMNTSGYNSKDPIVTFSHTHVSGTGGAGRYGNIGITPFVGVFRREIEPYEKKNEMADTMYYAVDLGNSGIHAEITCTQHVGVHRYTFPEGEGANILLDVGSVVKVTNNREDGGAYSIGGFVEILNDTQIMGRSDCKGGWGHDFPYSVYFFAEFEQPFVCTICGNEDGFGKKGKADGADSFAMLSFEGNVVEIKVGISFVSTANARDYLKKEAEGLSFEQVHQNGLKIWNELFHKISVEGGTEKHTSLFYSLFNRLMWGPTDLGKEENPYWKSDVRNFTDYYCLWDSVRNANSLIGLFDPQLETDYLNCLLDIAEHVGWLPDAWVCGHGAMVQGGSSADILLCEAALKKYPNIDYNKALKYMRKNNEVESPDSWLYGRHLKNYKEKGYVANNVERACVSKHLEYAYQDWCIGKLAQIMGEEELARKNFEDSKKVWNLWREDIKLFAPRKENGEFETNFNPDFVRPDPWNDPNFYEASAWQWMYSVHHDFQGLIEHCGGREAFIERLDCFFEEGHYHSKETMLHIPYLYIYAGIPEKTFERVRDCIDKYYRNTRNGISDNEDMGCQSAFYMCSAMGLYPIMGQDLYMISAPIFDKITVQMGDKSRSLVIQTKRCGLEDKYVVGATLNGEKLERAWIRHEEITDGGVLELILDKQSNGWGNDMVPPSPMSEKDYLS